MQKLARHHGVVEDAIKVPWRKATRLVFCDSDLQALEHYQCQPVNRLCCFSHQPHLQLSGRCAKSSHLISSAAAEYLEEFCRVLSAKLMEHFSRSRPPGTSKWFVRDSVLDFTHWILLDVCTTEVHNMLPALVSLDFAADSDKT